MKFLFDQDLPNDLAYALQASGHEVPLVTERLGMHTDDAAGSYDPLAGWILCH